MIKDAGFFRELRHGWPDGPSLVGANRQELPDKTDVVAYLNGCSPLAVTGGTMTQDFLSKDNTVIGPLLTRTDGKWMWPGDLAYYVEVYDIELPADFVSHIRDKSCIPADLTVDELISIQNQLFEDLKSP